MEQTYSPTDYQAWQAAQSLIALVSAKDELEILRTENAALRAAVQEFAGCLSYLQPGC